MRLLSRLTHSFVRNNLPGRLAGPPALETARIHILSSAKQRAKQGDLGLDRGLVIDQAVSQIRWNRYGIQESFLSRAFRPLAVAR